MGVIGDAIKEPKGKSVESVEEDVEALGFDLHSKKGSLHTPKAKLDMLFGVYYSAPAFWDFKVEGQREAAENRAQNPTSNK